MDNPGTHFRLSWVLVLLVGLPASGFLLAAVGCGGNQEELTVFRMRGYALYRDERPYFLRAVESREVGDPGVSILAKAELLNRICGAGANSVVVGIPQVECVTGSPVSLWLSEFAALKVETEKRSMGLILKADGACGASTENLTDYLLKSFGQDQALLLWIDGPRSDEIIRTLRARGSRNVLIGPGVGSDLVVTSSPGSGSNRRAVAYDPSDLAHSEGHFILSAHDSALDQLDAVDGGQEPVYLGPADPDGFLTLFDGTSLAAWKVTGDPSGWAVGDGAILWKHPGGGRLQTLSRYSDFILRLEWKIEDGRNSGLFIRCPAAGRESRIGMELQLYGDSGKPPSRNGTASIYDVVAPSRNASLPADQWNRMEVECRGTRLRVTLNDAMVQDCDLGSIPELKVRLRNGFIALQDHGDPVAFRNIRIKPL